MHNPLGAWDNLRRVRGERSVGLVGLVLGAACATPDPLPLDGLELTAQEVYLLIDARPEGRRVRRLQEGAAWHWSQAEDLPLTLELWAYDCAGRLPDPSTWGPAPDCLPPPKRRHAYNPEAERWQPVEATAAPLIGPCTECELSRLRQVPFEFPRRPVPYLASAVLLSPDRVLALVGDATTQVPPSYFWIKEAEVRALEVTGPVGNGPPHLGAMLKRADGVLLGVGESLWRLRLVPEDDPTTVQFEPWAPGLPELEELAEGRGAAAELSSEAAILVSALGGVYQLGPRGLSQVRAPRPRIAGQGSHPVELVPFGTNRHLVVGVGDGTTPNAEAPVEMTDYGLITWDPGTQTSTVIVYPTPGRPRGAASVRGRAYLSDQAGALWRVRDQGIELLASNLLDNGPIGALGDRLLLSGAKTLIQQVLLDSVEACEAEPAVVTLRIISGERSAYLLSGEGGSWLRPGSLCEGSP